jgi:glycosyltransferase involved in cell wall biosynthesis
MLIDVFVDATRTRLDADGGGAIRRLSRDTRLGAVVRCGTWVMPAGERAGGEPAPRGWDIRNTGTVEACRDAMIAAADAECPLLMLFGDLRPTAEAVGLLREALDSDPMVGFAVPRLTGTRDDTLATLDRSGDDAIDELPRRILSEVPETYLIADLPARCVLVAPRILADFGELDDRFRSLEGALWHCVVRARRCGFRTLVCNRAVVRAPSPARPCPPCAITRRSLPDVDRALLRELAPDVERTSREFGTAGLGAAETRLARALFRSYDTRPSLLLDARNVGATINGTTIAALGTSRGLHALRSGWDITLLASAEASTFHHLEESFPDWDVVTKLPPRQFTAALRLSQPWHIQEMVDLHTLAAFNAYLFLDTISWDVAYPAPRHLDGTWAFMADHADGLVFISEFTRDRFHRRFPGARDLPHLVSYLSFSPFDYVDPDLKPPVRQDEYMFIVGNEYDHKDVGPTLELLSTAFPYESIVALGAARPATPRIKVLQSGTLSDAEIHRLYAGARLVLFPSFYEGFGFPILTTLAYGRTVVARHSTLLDEIAARCVPRGRIVPFSRRDELVDIVGALLHGGEVPTLPLGGSIENGQPMAWTDVGRSILRFLDDLTSQLSRSRWRARDHAIAQLMAAPTALVDRAVRPPSMHEQGSPV